MLVYYAGYTEEEVEPVVQLMVDYLARPVVHEAFFKKYANKKFLKGMSHLPILRLPHTNMCQPPSFLANGQRRMPLTSASLTLSCHYTTLTNKI